MKIKESKATVATNEKHIDEAAAQCATLIGSGTAKK
jgi:hypothetical protein